MYIYIYIQVIDRLLHNWEESASTGFQKSAFLNLITLSNQGEWLIISKLTTISSLTVVNEHYQSLLTIASHNNHEHYQTHDH